MVHIAGWVAVIIMIILFGIIPREYLVVGMVIAGFLVWKYRNNIVVRYTRWAFVLSSFVLASSFFYHQPRVGEVCYGYIDRNNNYLNNVHVVKCDTLGRVNTDIAVLSGKMDGDVMYTFAKILVRESEKARYYGTILDSGSGQGNGVGDTLLLEKLFCFLWRFGYLTRVRLFTVFSRIADREVASTGVSILYGPTGSIDDIEKLFRDLGISFLTAVSGVNIAYLLGFIASLKGKQPKSRWCNGLEIVAIVLLFVIVGPAVSFLRAVVTFMLQRTVSWLGFVNQRWWIFTVFTMLAILQPLVVYEAGYWLVSAACVGVFCIAPRIGKFVKNVFVRTICESIAVWLCVFPVTLCFFGEVKMSGLVIGLLVGPLVEIISVTGYLLTPVGLVIPIILQPYAIIISVLLWLLRMFHGIAAFCE